ncbi:MAG TPA: type VI secretion system-associated protein TagO [Paracoccaceae bacterium]|nr:type VI secretion system-associated protein TagO [Paracoccaceae bacterium]
MKVIAIAAAAIVMALGSPAFSEGIDACARVESELDRLACYDRISGRTPDVEQKTDGNWQAHIETSKLTDQTNVYLTVASNELIRCRWDSEPVTLTVRCMENTTSLILSTSCHVTSRVGGYGKVEYRTDSDKARTAWMDASTNNRSLGLWRGGASIPVIKQLFGKDQLIARFTPYSESSKTATFNIGGLESAIEPLREACNW